MLKKHPKVALVYDRVNTPYGGAEKVLLALHTLFPKAPLFTSVFDEEEATWAKVFKVIPSFIQKIPGAKNHHRLLAPLMPIVFESFDFSSFDIIISITSAEAKGILTKPNQTHICYLLTPPRYLYFHKEESLSSKKIFAYGPGRWLANKLINYLSWWDQSAIHRPDVIIPISQRVKKRVKDYYNLETEEVIYPPVDVSINNTQVPKYQNTNLLKYYLIVSRLVYYKRIDLAIKACIKMNKRLVVVGTGPEIKNLKKIAINNKNIVFEKNISENKLRLLYSNCKAVIMPGEEDFGIVALEANSYRKPVIIYHKSGAAELIKNGEHGIHIKKQSVNGVVEAIDKLKISQLESKNLIKNASKYDTNVFVRKFMNNLKKLDL